jgi:hypothetical protein
LLILRHAGGCASWNEEEWCGVVWCWGTTTTDASCYAAENLSCDTCGAAYCLGASGTLSRPLLQFILSKIQRSGQIIVLIWVART